MAGERLGHEVLAGAVGASAIAAGAATGPLLATAIDLVAAAATAGIAAHAVETSARERGVSAEGVLHRAARVAVRRTDAPLAAHAVDAACRARSGDPRALRSLAMLLGRATSAHARGLALQLVGSWCAPLREMTRLGAPLEAARAALDSAAFIRGVTSTVPQGLPVVAELPLLDELPAPGPLSVSPFPSSSADIDEASREASQQEWEVAA